MDLESSDNFKWEKKENEYSPKLQQSYSFGRSDHIDKLINHITRRKRIKKEKKIKVDVNSVFFRIDALSDLYKISKEENDKSKIRNKLVVGRTTSFVTKNKRVDAYTILFSDGFFYFLIIHTFSNKKVALEYFKRIYFNITRVFFKNKKLKDEIIHQLRHGNLDKPQNDLFFKSIFYDYIDGIDNKKIGIKETRNLINEMNNFIPEDELFIREFDIFVDLVYKFKTTFTLLKLIEMFNSKTNYIFVNQIESNKIKFDNLRKNLYKVRKKTATNNDNLIINKYINGVIETENILKYKDDDFELYYSDDVINESKQILNEYIENLKEMMDKYKIKTRTAPHIWLDGTGGVPQQGSHIGKQIVYVMVYDIVFEKFRVLLIGIISNRMSTNKWITFLKLIDNVFNFDGVSTDNEKSLVSAAIKLNKKHYGDISHYQRSMISMAIKDKKKIRKNVMKIFKYWPLVSDRKFLFDKIVLTTDELLVYNWIKRNYFGYFTNLIINKNLDYKKFSTSVVEGMQNKWKYYRKYNTTFDSLNIFLKSAIFYIQRTKSKAKMHFITEPFLISLLYNIPDEYYSKKKKNFETIEQSEKKSNKELVYVSSQKYEYTKEMMEKKHNGIIKLLEKNLKAQERKANAYKDHFMDSKKKDDIIKRLQTDITEKNHEINKMEKILNLNQFIDNFN